MSRYFTNQYQRTWLVHFGIIKLAGAPFSLQKRGLWTPFGALSPPFGKRVSRGFFQKKCSQNFQKRVRAKSYSTKNTNRIYQPASARTILIPARRPVLGWLTTLQVKSLARQSCPNCSVHCQCRGPRGAFVCFCSWFCFLTEELLNRCCFAQGSICFGFNPNLKISREL